VAIEAPMGAVDPICKSRQIERGHEGRGVSTHNESLSGSVGLIPASGINFNSVGLEELL
jgi:hypothetical protein